MQPVVVSFYTENTPYQLEVLSLIASCREWDIECEIEGVPCWGSWERNCARKPAFLLRKLQEKKRPLFWVDADAIFKQKPNFSFLQECDVAFRDVSYFFQDKRFRYRSGSVFINHTPQGMQFAQRWAAYCQKYIESGKELSFVDQIALFDLMQEGGELHFCALPPSYCKVCNDERDAHIENVVIEHFQASCRLK